LILLASSYERGGLEVTPGGKDKKRSYRARLDKIVKAIDKFSADATVMQKDLYILQALSIEVTPIYQAVFDLQLDEAAARKSLRAVWKKHFGKPPSKKQLDQLNLGVNQIHKLKGAADAALHTVGRVAGGSSGNTLRKLAATIGEPLDTVLWRKPLSKSIPNRLLVLEYVLINLLGLSKKDYRDVLEFVEKRRPGFASRKKGISNA
jgi:hypothetical protein